MDANLILTRELQDSKYIHLYHDSMYNQWVAYGESAFALRLYVKLEGFDSLRAYSTELKMPYTTISHKTMNALRQKLKMRGEDAGQYVAFDIPNNIGFSNSDYLMWMDKLYRDGEMGMHHLDIKTMVSDFVPKDVFIPDGMSSFARNSKRLFDFMVASVTLLLFSPLMVICYIAIKMDDGGPAIFAQERIGRFGRTFNIYKFRSMRLDAEKAGPQLSAQQGQGDSRLTKVGRFLRAHHLDELPQLWNVFCGDMSFIGPRPERQYFINQILEYDHRYTYLYQIRPGVTSYATLYNGYTDTIEKMLKRLEYDLYYLGHRSWPFDVKILWLTFWKIVSGKDI